ncbi:MAG TPA: VOC family protein [Candidatus Eisenbacteria bacterium]|jgi:predicted enzyme related to lactoylglutathione lyase
MSRLMYAIAFTRNFDSMKEFYTQLVGLPVRNEEPQWVEFDTGGAILALHEMRDENKQGMVLRFVTPDLDAERRAIEGRGARMEAPFRLATGRGADVWDPEGNLISLFEPQTPARPGAGPGIERVILNVRDFGRAVSFYRGPMGLAVAGEAEHWVEFDTGDARLTVHHRPADGEHPRHAEQPVAVVFGTDDLSEWCETMRGRGLHFVTAPVTEEFGVYAEAADPDGRIVVFCEPPPPVSLEEELAEAFEDDDAPQRIAIRKPVKKASATASMLAIKPSYKPKQGRPRRRPSATTMSVVSVRGAGPERTRLKPRRTADEKKARVKPARGRLLKAEQRTIASQKTQAARVSKSRPVKRAAARTARRRGK